MEINKQTKRLTNLILVFFLIFNCNQKNTEREILVSSICNGKVDESIGIFELKILKSIQDQNLAELLKFFGEETGFVFTYQNRTFIKSKDSNNFLKKQSYFYIYLFDSKKMIKEMDIKSFDEPKISFYEALQNCVEVTASSILLEDLRAEDSRKIFISTENPDPDKVYINHKIWLHCDENKKCKIDFFDL